MISNCNVIRGHREHYFKIQDNQNELCQPLKSKPFYHLRRKLILVYLNFLRIQTFQSYDCRLYNQGDKNHVQSFRKMSLWKEKSWSHSSNLELRPLLESDTRILSPSFNLPLVWSGTRRALACYTS